MEVKTHDPRHPIPSDDGITHINIYSQSKCKLGRMLSNFYNCEFRIFPYGTFQSIEGFYYYLRTGRRFDKFKTLSGIPAKALGSTLVVNSSVAIDTDILHSLIYQAISLKLENNKELQELILGNELPYDHYYVRSNNQPQILPQHKWLTKFIDFQASELKRINTLPVSTSIEFL